MHTACQTRQKPVCCAVLLRPFLQGSSPGVQAGSLPLPGLQQMAVKCCTYSQLAPQRHNEMGLSTAGKVHSGSSALTKQQDVPLPWAGTTKSALLRCLYPARCAACSHAHHDSSTLVDQHESCMVTLTIGAAEPTRGFLAWGFDRLENAGRTADARRWHRPMLYLYVVLHRGPAPCELFDRACQALCNQHRKTVLLVQGEGIAWPLLYSRH